MDTPCWVLDALGLDFGFVLETRNFESTRIDGIYALRVAPTVLFRVVKSIKPSDLIVSRRTTVKGTILCKEHTNGCSRKEPF
jgi:hypothetical protein